MNGWRHRAPARRLNRKQVIHAVIVTGSLAALAFAVGVWTLVAVVVDQGRKIDALFLSATENRAKLVSVGEQPVGPPPEQIVGKPGPAGQDGTDGAPGAPGATGPAGRDGRDGKDASPQQVAAAVAAYMAAHPVKPATPGRDGRDGADGVSPACLAEPDECRGPAGPAGPEGPAGAAGEPGARGEPPAAWRWTDPATGTAYDCSRDPATSDSAPVYACAAVR